jgi:hypothetical protein
MDTKNGGGISLYAPNAYFFTKVSKIHICSAEIKQTFDIDLSCAVNDCIFMIYIFIVSLSTAVLALTIAIVRALGN